MPLRIRLLGGLAVEGVAERDLGSRKARTVLKVLALARGQPVAVDTLADVLWGDDQPSRPGDQVGVLVSRASGACWGPTASPARTPATRWSPTGWTSTSSTSSRPRAALVHREAARALAARPGADPLAVAVHARQGGHLRLAASSYVAATEAAAARFNS